MITNLLPDPAVPHLIPSVPKNFSEEKIVDGADVDKRHCLKESGQWLENVDQTHVILASFFYKKAFFLLKSERVKFPLKVLSL